MNWSIVIEQLGRGWGWTIRTNGMIVDVGYKTDRAEAKAEATHKRDILRAGGSYPAKA